MTLALEEIGSRLEDLARDLGLDYYPVHFEEVPPSFMMEIAVYGLPVRMPHWSFGVRYIYQLVQHRMGNSRLFEVVFPGNPGRAYLARGNSIPENTLVMAHVLGHADFSKHNELFHRSQEEVGYRIVDQAASHARRIGMAIEEYGQERVEEVLDAALALEAQIDTFKGVRRTNSEMHAEVDRAGDSFQSRFNDLPGEKGRGVAADDDASPDKSETDLLWYIANNAPELAGWERDIFLAVREESFYFYPVFACQIMNEGWASYWHARLLREAPFLAHDHFVDAMKTHSDVVRPVAGEKQLALDINPYHLGFTIWDRMIEAHGVEHARQVMCSEDDFGFVRNHLDADLADEMNLFLYDAKRNGEVKVVESEIHKLHEAILAPKFGFAAPRVCVTELGVDGTLELLHDSDVDGRGLDLDRARKVADYIHEVWRRPVKLNTQDAKGEATVIDVGAAA